MAIIRLDYPSFSNLLPYLYLYWLHVDWASVPLELGPLGFLGLFLVRF